MNSSLFQQINYDKAYRKNRLEAAHWVLQNPDSLGELLDYCFDKAQGDLSHKATWVLEFVCLENLSKLYPHLNIFFQELHAIKKDQSLRPLSHICELLAIELYKNKSATLAKVFLQEYKLKMTECSFDWLISDQKVACQVRAMTSLYYLGTEFDWIHPELKQIIQQNIHHGSGGYKARGKRILGLIKKFER